MNPSLVGSWNLDSNSIFSGTKWTTTGVTTAAGQITLNSGGSIHTPKFFVDANGDAGFKGVYNDSRKISFSSFLNDPSEFEGGDLTLMPDSIGYPIQLKKYEICFFPSWMPHKVVPVTKGTRISLVGWVHGPDFV